MLATIKYMLLLNFSLCRQVVAINKLSNVGMYFWDYGNAFLHQASLAGLSKDEIYSILFQQLINPLSSHFESVCVTEQHYISIFH